MALNQVGLERLNTATTKKIGTNKNLIINGAMEVAQRGTSSTSTGYQTVDRVQFSKGGTDETPTQAQVDVSSGTTPYTSGFRKAYKITNGNQTGGAGTSDNIIAFRYHIEAQDIANSGWNYTSTSSYITLSFWIKSSVAQSFQGVLTSEDGTRQIYPFATGSLSADTWTKITKTIPGNSNITFNNDNGKGLTLEIIGFSGSDFATDSATINAWQARTSGNQFGRASTSTWYTTDNATLEMTGFQLEVGSVATDFEHRSFAQELALCQRYYQVLATGNQAAIGNGFAFQTNRFQTNAHLTVEMRTTPTLDEQMTGATKYRINMGNADQNTGISPSLASVVSSTRIVNLGWSSLGSNVTNGDGGQVRKQGDSGILGVSAEL
tara:strand:- start:247 stop:1383 length:1137 start_codon:yes stop_codon:yes gene_type:complete